MRSSTASRRGRNNLPRRSTWSLQLADCAFAYRSIPAPLQDAAIAKFGVPGLIEIVTLCGYYALIGMVNCCFDVPLPHRQGQ